MPELDDPPKILPDSVWLVLLEEAGVDDLTLFEAVVCSLTSGLVPRKTLFRCGEGLGIFIPLVCGLPKVPVTGF